MLSTVEDSHVIWHHLRLSGIDYAPPDLAYFPSSTRCSSKRQPILEDSPRVVRIFDSTKKCHIPFTSLRHRSNMASQNRHMSSLLLSFLRFVHNLKLKWRASVMSPCLGTCVDGTSLHCPSDAPTDIRIPKISLQVRQSFLIDPKGWSGNLRLNFHISYQAFSKQHIQNAFYVLLNHHDVQHRSGDMASTGAETEESAKHTTEYRR